MDVSKYVSVNIYIYIHSIMSNVISYHNVFYLSLYLYIYVLYMFYKHVHIYRCSLLLLQMLQMPDSDHEWNSSFSSRHEKCWWVFLGGSFLIGNPMTTLSGCLLWAVASVAEVRRQAISHSCLSCLSHLCTGWQTHSTDIIATCQPCWCWCWCRCWWWW